MQRVALVGVEAGGEGMPAGGTPPALAIRSMGRPGVLHGAYTYVLQTADGQIADTHSISAGLDYAAVGPEHALLHDTGRAVYTTADDRQALDAFQLLGPLRRHPPGAGSRRTPWPKPSRLAPLLGRDQILLVNLSGRGDKDLDTVLKALKEQA